MTVLRTSHFNEIDMAKTNKAFQNRLINYRHKHNLSLREMASRLDVTTTTIYQWENTEGRGVSSTSIRKLCRLFGISHEKLFSEVQDGEIQDANDGFVKFTFLSGNPLYVKPETIKGFWKNEDEEGSFIFFGNKECMTVKESVSEIRGVLND